MSQQQIAAKDFIVVREASSEPPNGSVMITSTPSTTATTTTTTTPTINSQSILMSNNNNTNQVQAEEKRCNGSFQEEAIQPSPEEEEHQQPNETLNVIMQEENNHHLNLSSSQDASSRFSVVDHQFSGSSKKASFADEESNLSTITSSTNKACLSQEDITTTTTTLDSSSPTQTSPQERKRRISSRLPLTSTDESTTTAVNSSTNGFDEEDEESDDSSSSCYEDESQQDDELSNQIQDNYFNARSRRVSLCGDDILGVKKSEDENTTQPTTSSTSTARNVSNSILVVNEAINSYPSVNEIRSPRDDLNEAPKVYSSIIFESKHDSKRIQQFEEIAANYHEFVTKNPKQFRKLIREGIPTKELLKTIWKRMVGSEELSNKYPGLYKKLTQLDDTILEDDVHRIMKDVYRTYPQYEFFSEKDGPGQKALCRILKAYCYFDKQTGYCQGMAFICGFALMNLEDEEDTFWFFVQIMNNARHGLKDIFCEGLPRLRMVMFMVSELTKLRLPDIHKHLEDNYILPEMYASSILMTLCTNRFTFTASQRIWSIFLNEGWKM